MGISGSIDFCYKKRNPSVWPPKSAAKKKLSWIDSKKLIKKLIWPGLLYILTELICIFILICAPHIHIDSQNSIKYTHVPLSAPDIVTYNMDVRPASEIYVVAALLGIVTFAVTYMFFTLYTHERNNNLFKFTYERLNELNVKEVDIQEAIARMKQAEEKFELLQRQTTQRIAEVQAERDNTVTRINQETQRQIEAVANRITELLERLRREQAIADQQRQEHAQALREERQRATKDREEYEKTLAQERGERDKIWQELSKVQGVADAATKRADKLFDDLYVQLMKADKNPPNP